MIIAVDFDGTIIENMNFPGLGPELPYAFEVLRWLKSQGHQLILWTCRANKSLDIAVEFCKVHGVEFDAINDNVKPMPHLSKKIFCDLLIDDTSWPNRLTDKLIGWREIAGTLGYHIHG